MNKRSNQWVAGGAVALACVVVSSVMAQSLSENHFNQASKPAQAKAALAAVQPSDIVEIAIECAGSGPQYSAVLKADGTATFTGVKAAPRIGSFAGTLTSAAFQALAAQAVQIGYFGLANTYKSVKMDMGSVSVARVPGAWRCRKIYKTSNFHTNR